MIERRHHPRIRMDSVAFIQTRTGHPVACRIRDRSEGGARLVVDSVLGIPNQFRLRVQKTGEELAAIVVWRGPQEIGVAFQEADGLLAVPANPATGTRIDIPLGPHFAALGPKDGPQVPVADGD